MPSGRVSEAYLHVHPAFRALFTSNPEEYAGVHKTQDALLDRMVTITIGQYDRETEVRITAAKSGLDEGDAGRIVDIVRDFRELGILPLTPTVRACIMIAKVTALRGSSVRSDDRGFLETCRDVLRVAAVKITRDGIMAGGTWLDEIVARHCSSSPRHSTLRGTNGDLLATNGHHSVN
jgi:gas vesicle protein GvpN